MKILVLVGDGMGDEPVAALDGRTPLQAARIPAMRRIAARARMHQVSTVPDALPPGSDVCNMGLLGYNAAENYTGRAPIEAAGAGIALDPADVAFRCNLVTVADGCMKDYSAGHISTGEAAQLLHACRTTLERDGLRFYPGISYRHLLVWRDGPVALNTQPPHDIADQAVQEHLPAGERAEEVIALMDASKAVLAEHAVNQQRRTANQNPATQCWLWGQGRALHLPSFHACYGLTGGVITAVDLVRGLGCLAGLDVPEIEGVTGFIDTNYAGKVAAAQQILDQHPYAYVHVEAPDECGHMGDAALKTRAIELFDENVVAPLWAYLEEKGEPYRLVLAMDHRTPVAKRAHTRDPVPMAVLEGPVGPVTDEAPFDESVLDGLPLEKSYHCIRNVLARA